jgi:ribosomal-protein-alanine N-acetyltransferase
MSLKDAGDYFELASDPAVTVFTIWETHKTIDDTYQYLNYVLDKHLNKQAYHWGIIDKLSLKLIGRTGLIHWDVSHQRVELGFALSNSYWNKGIITEATNVIINYCFKELNVNRIEGRCNYDNTGSSRVMEKLGMVYEGILREQLKIKGQFVDQKMYSVIKSDFEGYSKEGSSIR